jgi:hypothetical protein
VFSNAGTGQHGNVGFSNNTLLLNMTANEDSPYGIYDLGDRLEALYDVAEIVFAHYPGQVNSAQFRMRLATGELVGKVDITAPGVEFVV